ncbi:MAG: hypothetical protein Q9183_007597, partial [Haloplaca sp. 2 TL-2023]
MPPNLPEEIRIIIQESMDEQRAVRLSKLQEKDDIIFRDAIYPGGVHRNFEESAMAESSAMAAARNSKSPSMKFHKGSGNTLHSWTTSLNFDDNVIHPLNSADDKDGQSAMPSAETYRPEIYSSSRKIQTSRGKLSKAHGLFKVLRRSKDATSTTGVDSGPATYECTSCFDDIPKKEAILVPCNHRYCYPCFSQLIATAIQNEDHFPPKCCLQEIPRRVLRQKLKGPDLASFDAKALEYSVAIGSRYYCARPECAKWIDTTKAKHLNSSRLQCPHCRHNMCTLCRGPSHPSGQDCPQDFALDATLQQAERAGWQRCYNCRAMVELNTG